LEKNKLKHKLNMQKFIKFGISFAQGFDRDLNLNRL